MITSASTGLFASAGGAIRAGWCKRRGRRIKQQSSAARTSQGRSFLMALEAVTPRQREQRTLPDRTGQRGQRTAAAWSSRAGYTQGPRPRLRGPWALSFAVLGVLLLMRSRRESWLKKVLLVAWKRPGGTWLGKSQQDPPGQVQYTACWWWWWGGARGVRIPGIYSLPRRAGSLEHLTSGLAPDPGSIRSSFLSFPFPFPSADPPHSCLSLSFSILHCIYLLTRVLCKSSSVGPTFPPPLP